MIKKILSIATATPKDIEKILLDIALAHGIDKRVVTVFVVTGGLHYVFEHIAKDLYLLPKIDPDTRLLMRIIDIGFNLRISHNNLFEANERIKSFNGWGIDQEIKKLADLHNEFYEKVKLIEQKK